MSDIINAKAVKRILLTLAAGGAVGFCLLLLAYAMPTERMIQNATASIEIFTREGIYPETVYGYRATTLDNYTDAWMIRNAIYNGDEPLLERCLNVYFYGYTHEETKDVCESLVAYLQGMQGYERISYNEYWHGYLIVLKPLLYFLDYGDIRQLLKSVALALVIAVSVLMERRHMARYIPAFIAAIVCVEFSTIGMSMQYTSVFIIALAFCVFLLRKYPETVQDCSISIVFLIIGMCTSYFDFLTYPVFTLGIPLIVLLLCRFSSGEKKGAVKTVLYHSIFWGIGYFGFWLEKWILCNLLTEENVIGEAFLSITERVGRQVVDQPIGYMETVFENFKVLCKYPYALAILGVTALILWGFRKKRLKTDWEHAAACLIVAVYPFIWYAVALNHSYVHAFMTYRDLGISIFAGLCMLESMKEIDCNERKET